MLTTRELFAPVPEAAVRLRLVELSCSPVAPPVERFRLPPATDIEETLSDSVVFVNKEKVTKKK